jgi:hypothetical protein
LTTPCARLTGGFDSGTYVALHFCSLCRAGRWFHQD